MLRLTSLRSSLFTALALSGLALSTGGCQLIAGLGGEETLGKGGSGGTTGTTSGGGGTGTTLTGTCTAGDTLACYSGPDGTQGTGACKGGTATCGADSMWSACEGEVVPQIESCAAPADEDCNGLDCTVWVKVFMGDVNGSSVAVDADGNVLASITFSTGIDLGDGTPVVPVGGNDMALLKYDKAGTLVWKKVFPAGGYQYVQSIGVDKKGNIALSGSSDSQIDFGFGKIGPGLFVAKLDPTGKVLWASAAVTNIASISNTAIDSMGNVFVAGNGDQVDFGTGLLAGGDPSNFFVAKLDGATGATDWAKITKGGAYESVAGIAVDPSDSLVIAGVWSGMYLGLTGDANVPNDLYNCCNADAPFLIRLDPDGNLSNGKMLAGYQGGLNMGISGIANDALGTSTLVGNFSGKIDFSSGMYDAGQNNSIFILHDQTSGFDQTSKVFIEDGVYAYPNDVGLDGHGNIVMDGNFSGPLDLGGGVLPPGKSKFVTKLDKDGNFLWARTYAFGDGGFNDMAVGTLEDETVLIGTYYGNVDIGTGPLTGNGMFLIKLGK